MATTGFGAAQITRFATNIVLSRLLVPEVFGQAALLTVFSVALIMLTDIGVEAAVVQNQSGDDDGFLATAWSIQFVRGVCGAILGAVLAWPFVQITGSEGMLIPFLVISTLSIAQGSKSIMMAHSIRRERLEGPVAIEFLSQVIGAVVLIIAASITPTVWAPVAGLVATNVGVAVLSQLWFQRVHLRWHWEPEHAEAIIRFGRWLLVSAGLTFLAGQLDRILIARTLGEAPLGLYSLAIGLAGLPMLALGRVVRRVVLPEFARLHREDAELVSTRASALQVRMLPAATLFAVAMSLLGPRLVEALYAENFHDAGQLVAALGWWTAVRIGAYPYRLLLIAGGFTSRLAGATGIEVGAQLIGTLVGAELGGIRGACIGLAASGVVGFVSLWFIAGRSRRDAGRWEGLWLIAGGLLAWTLIR